LASRFRTWWQRGWGSPYQIDPRLGRVLLPVVIFVSLYSLLPHKEMRFVLVVVPVFTAVSAVGLVKLFQVKNRLWLLVRAGVVAIFLVGLGLVVGLLYVSSLNYPGGYALSTLHSKFSSSPPSSPLRSVHIGNLAAINGVTRFGEWNHRFVYSKTEHLFEPHQFASFDLLIEEFPPLFFLASSSSSPSSSSPSSFSLVATIDGFSGVDLSLSTCREVVRAIVRTFSFAPLASFVRTEPVLFIYQNIHSFS